METGLEGFEVESSLQHHLKKAIVERMRADSQREFRRWLHSRQETGLYVDTHFMDSAVGLSPRGVRELHRLSAPPHTNSLPGRGFHSTPASPTELSPVRGVLSPPILNRHHSDTLRSHEVESERSGVPYHRTTPLSVPGEEATPRPLRANRLSSIFSFPRPSESTTR
ncbi:Protein of unknown function [Pyronema omphalodes CBS 100304]|uniref:Uncharacterized protein n=1 Tax=Pyronema omphalodes (strain CBS 100304) TaxID=1076935 RepID=U4L5X1_PYROM|nr:Protein of unknown function [Pyronema omphalodes CBS 100304]